MIRGATCRRSRGEPQQFGPAVSGCNIIIATKKVKAAAIITPAKNLTSLSLRFFFIYLGGVLIFMRRTKS